MNKGENLAPKIDPADRLGAVKAVPESAGLAGADLSNVVVLSQRRDDTQVRAPAVVLGTERPEVESPRRMEMTRWTAFLGAAMLVHLAFILFLLGDPPPLASVGLEAISVEIVLGSNEPAGVAKMPSESEAQPAPSDPEENADTQVVQKEAERTEKLERDESQEPDIQDAQPAPKQEPSAAAAQPANEPVDIAPAPKTGKANEKPAEKPREKADPKRKNAAPASVASSGIGRGQSSLARNYPSLVAAHLARHKQYPATARASGSGGTATVIFSIDGRGRMTSVRLAQSSGVTSLDVETQAMVRRASPFPAPPPGAPTSFTVPVSFNLR